MTGAGVSLPATLIRRTQHPVNEDLTFLVLRQLQANPKQTQLQLSQAIGISVGRTNYVVRALIERGLLKAEHFRNSKNKSAYAYLLTPEGIDTKARITARFIQRKRAEYDALRAELDQLTAEAEAEGLLPQ
nr:MarR family EPS-associated transcriptional regulator [Lamprobacter modestohalophilus]